MMIVKQKMPAAVFDAMEKLFTKLTMYNTPRGPRGGSTRRNVKARNISNGSWQLSGANLVSVNSIRFFGTETNLGDRLPLKASMQPTKVFKKTPRAQRLAIRRKTPCTQKTASADYRARDRFIFGSLGPASPKKD